MSATFPAQKINRRKTRTALIGQGQRMSNWLYNVAQAKDLPPYYREEARFLNEAWDKIVREGRDALQKETKG